jgi:hypothetical protein
MERHRNVEGCLDDLVLMIRFRDIACALSSVKCTDKCNFIALLEDILPRPF